MEKKSIWKLALTIAKYVITLALGYLGGSEDVINSLM